MSDGKEVKDADRGPHESWCDTQNNISERCNCMASSYIDSLVSYETVVAELRAEVERLKQVRKRQTRMLINAIGLRDETIATQAKVIEIATRTMATVLELEHCGRTSCPRPTRAMCSNESHKVLRSALREIAAIEKEGAKDE